MNNLNLVVNKGESILIVGDSGSGKTTLARIMLGTATSIYEGELEGLVEICGEDISIIQADVLHKRIHVISQNPYVHFIEPLVYDDLSSYSVKLHGAGPEAERALWKAVETLGIHSLLYKYHHELSGGEARRVLVAKALIADSKILVFDEPLMWLDEKGADNFLDLLQILKRMGKTIIIFEHRFLRLINAGFDRVYLLKNGRLFDVYYTLMNALKKTPVARQADSPPSIEAKKRVLAARGVIYRVNGREILRGLSLELFQGDKVLVYGENGAGKTTLLKILAGYIKPTKGKIVRETSAIYIPQNIVLFFNEATVRDEIQEICKARRLGSKCIEDGIRRVKDLGIDLDQSPFNLSHGQMVKLAITVSTISNTELILMDEPFSGLSYSDRAKLIDYIKKTKATVLLTTSSLDAIQSHIWTRMLKLEDGVVKDLDIREGNSSLEWASRIYEEISYGIGY